VKQEKVNIFAIDALRAISILAVVLIHTTTRVLENSGYNLALHPLTLFFNQAARFAVPMFFLISGFVLELHYHLNESFVHFLKKRFAKVFIPFLFWSLIYYYFIYTKHNAGFLETLVSGNASYQLYFIPSLLIFYFIFPLLHRIYRFVTNPISLLAIGVLEVYLLYLDYYVKHFVYFFPVIIFTFNLFIFIVGMAASHNQHKVVTALNKIRYILLPLVLIFAYFIFNEGRTLYLKTYDIGKFYSQWRPDVLIYTLLVSSLFYLFFVRTDFEHNYIKKISKLSFFVYFIHVLVLEYVWRYLGVYANIFGFGTIFFILVSLISLLIAWLVHKIPNISKITG